VQDRESKIRRVAVGDIFHASAPNGASLICLAEEVTETTIRARTVTNHFSFEFDRTTGNAEFEYEGRPAVTCTIDSVATLFPQVHDILLELDRKYGSDDDPKLTTDQKRALLFAWRFYPANAIGVQNPPLIDAPLEKILPPEEFQQRILVAFQIPGPRE
jgi:hypothetical protein